MAHIVATSDRKSVKGTQQKRKVAYPSDDDGKGSYKPVTKNKHVEAGLPSEDNDKRDEEWDDNMEESEEMKKSAKGTQQKRKVGDPSDDQGKVVESSNDEGKSSQKSGKRPLGRPRIHPVKEGPPKPRGRPRKNHKNSMSDFPLPSATASRSAVLAGNSSSPVSPATEVSPRPGQGSAYPSEAGLAPLIWAAAVALRLKRHRSVGTSPVEEPPSWRRYRSVGTSPAEEPWVTAAPLTPSHTLSARTASATSRWVVRAGSPITGANAPTSSAVSIAEVADRSTPSAANAAACPPIFASPSRGDALAVADHGPSRVDAAFLHLPVAFQWQCGRTLLDLRIAFPGNAVAVTESAPNPADAAEEMSSLFSAPMVAPNLAFIDNEFGEPQGVKRAKGLARERNLVHLFPWITEDAFPAGKVEEEAARKKAEEEAARKKAEKHAARKKAEEEAARKKAEREAARKRAEEEVTRKKAEREAARKRAEEEAARKKAEEEEARKMAEEDERFEKFMESKMRKGL
ncbi:hypothetical protein BDK51DRAFT_31779 [Blyttiomyces helicus]|uniref:Uncharacterized protein n=1 Tax=Blyttiomyces helicus TaxID=388810 RepID=A0A4P9WJU1_9FUNG|nr:hypothetical protein BDK51DRAFT_31779 [Blyttiomyces helicus]|eukprot:RKO93044.1 hypothetical protein BDK51DRAFT_31779 [Blyttiomyces helicus]